MIEDAILNVTDTKNILDFIATQYYTEHQEDNRINCNICDDILISHIYGNVCAKHIPSYALW